MNSPHERLYLPASMALNRRRFLASLGAVGASAFLAACGGDEEGGGTASEGDGDAGSVAAADSFRFSNWPLYIDDVEPDTLDDFLAATGISVAYTEEINGTEEYFAKIREPLSRDQDPGADTFVAEAPLVERLTGLEWLAPLNKANIPNMANIEPSLADPAFDPGRTYTVPWFSGFVGLAYNKAAVGREITSLSEIFNPEFAGQVSLLDNFRQGLAMVLMEMGVNLADATKADVEAAAEKVAQAKADGQIRRFTGNDYADDLASGNLVIAVGYSGDVAQLQLDNPDLEFAFTEEGIGQFSDNMVIPTTTEPAAKAAVESFMNYYLDPVVAAKVTNWVQFISPVAGVGEELVKLDPDVGNNPLINPPAEVRNLAQDWSALSAEVEVEYTEIYNAVVSG